MSNARIALITGGSRGLGRSMAEHLAERGTDVVITYRSRDDEANKVVQSLQSKGRRAAALKLDVGNSSSFDGFVESMKSELSKTFDTDRFDYLVNNAGHGTHASFMETSEEQFDQLMAVHVKGPFFLTQKLVPLMRDGGRILNISTGLARFSFPGYAAYAAAKGAMEVLTRYQAKELGERKITANILAPGAIETDFGGGAVRDNADLNKMVASGIALGRVGLPADIGGAVSLLLSDESGWINGQRIEASGGQLI
ncbi:MAG: SDR family oxidoreductase [Myxococcales bacterium]|nr:SDR family oxidoreductase [Myxococcales bacterium]